VASVRPRWQKKVVLPAVLFGALGLAIVLPDRPIPYWAWALFTFPFIMTLTRCFVWLPVRRGAQASGLLLLIWALLVKRYSIHNYALRVGGVREGMIGVLFPLALAGGLIAVSALLRRYAKQNNA
jgi:hypothetical protein